MDDTLTWLKENQTWLIPVCTIICSGLTSSLAAARVTADNMDKRADIAFKRKKLEELYHALDNYCNNTQLHYSILHKLIGKPINMKLVNELLGKVKADEKGLSNVEMIINLYFTNLLGFLIKLQQRKRQLDEIVYSYIEKTKNSEDTSALSDLLDDQLFMLSFQHKYINKSIYSLGSSSFTDWFIILCAKIYSTYKVVKTEDKVKERMKLMRFNQHFDGQE